MSPKVDPNNQPASKPTPAENSPDLETLLKDSGPFEGSDPTDRETSTTQP